jgi:hypothetical protein
VSICIGNLLLFPGESEPASIDLSKAIKLQDVVFRPGLWRVKWIVMALQTITPRHRDLRQISIHIHHHLTLAKIIASIMQPIAGVGSDQWWDLDCLLVQFWESRSIRPKLMSMTEGGAEDQIAYLLPKLTKRGVIDICDTEHEY